MLNGRIFEWVFRPARYGDHQGRYLDNIFIDRLWQIPVQDVSIIFIGPDGRSITMRCACWPTRLPRSTRMASGFVLRRWLIPDRSGLARMQARLWADEDLRWMCARRLDPLVAINGEAPSEIPPACAGIDPVF